MKKYKIRNFLLMILICVAAFFVMQLSIIILVSLFVLFVFFVLFVTRRITSLKEIEEGIYEKATKENVNSTF